MNRNPKRLFKAGIICALLLVSAAAAAQGAPEETGPLGIENVFRGMQGATSPDRISTTLSLFILLTVLSLAPAIFIMTTSFLRIIVVFGFLRQAMATQQTPPNQVLIGLALILTFYIMSPIYQQVYDEAYLPYVNEEIGWNEAVANTIGPVRDFMFRQVRPKDLALFIDIARMERPQTRDDVPLATLTCGFILSEIRIAFQIGFIIYIPFLIIDMVVASTLMSMGMMMLPPVFVSLPFKIIMFVLADGWYLLIQELVTGFK
ncbi:MAG TPA: flagellar type III secretion system pore protein FliP [Candidatus Hydrogenedentes bacterium]|nr:flagellar type III secretion system pore protein FliP [Candidatus Hydrogenedentota bacterium]HQE81836.1 flagellar type III secretion system pore protein FliP [Candidatus Hydrogenedentota bacterium]HQH50872.1 flagellar type III secretion system pore protein FliP [Candidatus Hydrogenedentota bacterium]HQM48680.1 flagellar type III secretion system pore protein FliP [Candidatus Hydrogenedentota bacterium]